MRKNKTERKIEREAFLYVPEGFEEAYKRRPDYPKIERILKKIKKRNEK